MREPTFYDKDIIAELREEYKRHIRIYNMIFFIDYIIVFIVINYVNLLPNYFFYNLFNHTFYCNIALFKFVNIILGTALSTALLIAPGIIFKIVLKDRYTDFEIARTRSNIRSKKFRIIGISIVIAAVAFFAVIGIIRIPASTTVLFDDTVFVIKQGDRADVYEYGGFERIERPKDALTVTDQDEVRYVSDYLLVQYQGETRHIYLGDHAPYFDEFVTLLDQKTNHRFDLSNK